MGEEGEGSIGLFVYFYFAVDLISSRFILTSFVCIMCLQYYSPLETPPPPNCTKTNRELSFCNEIHLGLGTVHVDSDK